jgi:aminoglycoside phosphotransferase family enzyme
MKSSSRFAHDLMLQGQSARAEIRNLQNAMASMHQGINKLQADLADQKTETERVRYQWREELNALRRKLKLCDMPSCYTPGCTSDHK